MKKYTQDDFNKFNVIGGTKHCPSGDYTAIKNFGNSFIEWCSFGKKSIFSDNSVFGRWTSFGKMCVFGDNCEFGEGTSFEEG